MNLKPDLTCIIDTTELVSLFASLQMNSKMWLSCLLKLARQPNANTYRRLTYVINYTLIIS